MDSMKESAAITLDDDTRQNIQSKLRSAKVRERVSQFFRRNPVPLEEMGLSNRSFNALSEEGITDLSLAVLRYPDGFSEISQLGAKSVQEIMTVIENNIHLNAEKIGISLTDTLSEDRKATPSTFPEDAAAKVPSAGELHADSEQYAKIVQYYTARETPIDSLKLSTRAYNVLRRANIKQIYQALNIYPDGFIEMRNMGKKTSDEICRTLESAMQKAYHIITSGHDCDKEEQDNSGNGTVQVEIDPISEDPANLTLLELLHHPVYKDKAEHFLRANDVPLEAMNFSVRSYNALMHSGYKSLLEILYTYPDNLRSIKNIGAKSTTEIRQTVDSYMGKMRPSTAAYCSGNGQAKADPIPEDPANLTLLELLYHPVYKEKVERFLRANDVPLEAMNFSAHSYNALMCAGYKSLLEILYTYPGNLRSIKNIGAKSTTEICQTVDSYMEKLQTATVAFCNGEIDALHMDALYPDALYSDEYITEKLLKRFRGSGFEGLSFQQMQEALPEGISEERIKKCIGTLLASHKLEYVDFRCYRVYPSVFDVLKESTIDPRNKEAFAQRLSGKKLEEIGDDLGLTRERVRQLIQKAIDKLHVFLRNAYGVRLLDEDFYTYLYEHYDIPKELWSSYIGVPEETYRYLFNAYTHGSKPIEEAMNDPAVYVSLKYRIRDYLNRNMLLVDGILLENRREVIENYAMEKFCQDEMTYGEFIDRYNSLLQDNGVDFNEKLYYTDKIRRSRSNHLSDSMCCLWKQGERLRFYNIAERDYSELLETLNLTEFQNTEVSTLKFMNEYPDIMKKYDIRDQYELHNLLKKIVDPSTCQDISFSRQPTIRFGQFDRNQAIREVIETFSPISANELTAYLRAEYGYDKGSSMSNYLIPFMQYYHNGVFSVNFQQIPEARAQLLKNNLPDDFYFISEIKEIYRRIWPDADLDDINHRSLQMMGYTVLEKYVLTRHKTADSFFRDVLMKDDVFSITAIRKRFGFIQMYQQIWLELRRNMDILLFDKDQYLNIHRLEKLGITKTDLVDYCNQIFEQAPENSLFTVHSLKGQSNSKICSLGFGDLFFEELLAMSGKFLYVHTFGTVIFYKGALPSGLTKKYFCLQTLKAYDSVELDDYIADLCEIYGMHVADKYDIITAIKGTDLYYDNIMQKIYRNRNAYYAEFDE